jgi:hypothetical protein
VSCNVKKVPIVVSTFVQFRLLPKGYWAMKVKAAGFMPSQVKFFQMPVGHRPRLNAPFEVEALRRGGHVTCQDSSIIRFIRRGLNAGVVFCLS